MSMNMQTVITNFQQQLITLRKTESVEFFNLRNGWLSKLIDQLEGYHARELKILRDESLTQNGKMTAIRKLAEAFATDLAWIKHLVAKHSQDEARLRANLLSVPPVVENPVVREMRNQEIRRQLIGQSQAERDTAFLFAAEHDNSETLFALLDTPTTPLVSDEMKDRVLEARAKRLHPEMFANFQTNQLALEFASMLVELMARQPCCRWGGHHDHSIVVGRPRRRHADGPTCRRPAIGSGQTFSADTSLSIKGARFRP